MPLATALVDDDLVLIASGRGVLEQALDVSQIAELNQAGQASFQDGLRHLGAGAALLQAGPGALERWLGLALPAAPEQRPAGLLLALRPEGQSLRLSGRMDLPADTTLPQGGADTRLGQVLLGAVQGNPASLALVQDPARLATIPLLQPLLSRMAGMEGSAGPLPALVVGIDDGPLLAAASGGRWLLGTAADRPDPEALEASLAARGLIAAPLEVDDRSLLVWTRLQVGGGRRDGSPDQLQAPLAGWRWQQDGQAWWGESLDQLKALDVGGTRAARRRRAPLEGLGVSEAVLQWSLDGPGARSLLAAWQPWQRLTALAGGSLAGPVDGLVLALTGDDGLLTLEGRLGLEGA
jgi:hypothetical protein